MYTAYTEPGAWVLLLFIGLGAFFIGGVLFRNARGEDATAAWVAGGIVGFIVGWMITEIL